MFPTFPRNPSQKMKKREASNNKALPDHPKHNHLIIEDNTVYELDEACLFQKNKTSS